MGCDHNCESCSHGCSSSDKSSLRIETNKNNKIKKIYAIHSGKGGVGKSFVTSMLACQMAKAGLKVGILDADITGPSIPLSFGIKERIAGNGEVMFPQVAKNGVKIVSINLLLENQTDPVAWRGSILSSCVKQFYQDVLWEELDCLLIDMPPGTGDIALTVFQSIPVDGVIIVTTPQDLVSMIIGKAVNLANMMNINVVGLIENMAYMNCPCCNNPVYPFGPSKLQGVAEEFGVAPLASLPINPELNKIIDEGRIAELDYPYLDNLVELLRPKRLKMKKDL